MSGIRTVQISGWGNLALADAAVMRPEKNSDVRRILAEPDCTSLIARGKGRSYGDSSINENGRVVITDHLNRFLDFDQDNGILTCEPGVTFEEIIRFLLPRGFFPPVTPGTKFVSIGGAVAADVHGKNHHIDGSIGNFVERLELLTAGGDILTCSREENENIFWATIGGMGLTGFILSITLRLTPVESAFMTTDYIRLPNFDAAFERLQHDDESKRYSVAWIDCVAGGKSLGRSVLIEAEHTTVDELDSNSKRNPFKYRVKKKKNVPIHFPGFVLNSFSVSAFNTLYYAKHRSVTGKVIGFDPFFYPLDSVNNWNRIYGKRGFIQYQALLPPESSREGIRQLLEAISTSKMASFLAVLKKTGPANDGLLSYCRPGFTLALDLPNYGERLKQLTQKLDQIVLKHAGRLYLAKDSMMSPDTFRGMYPRLEEFEEIVRALDPNKRFRSSQSRRLGIAEK